jgi:hypothetical protein
MIARLTRIIAWLLDWYKSLLFLVTDDPLLEVQQGVFTFEAEGDDDPKSPQFSRKLHVFSNSSGVTIGRGYDMKDRSPSQIKKDLVAVGMKQYIADKFANAVNLTGSAAKKWIKVGKHRGTPTYNT